MRIEFDDDLYTLMEEIEKAIEKHGMAFGHKLHLLSEKVYQENTGIEIRNSMHIYAITVGDEEKTSIYWPVIDREKKDYKERMFSVSKSMLINALSILYKEHKGLEQ